jgi:hypothetical protein
MIPKPSRANPLRCHESKTAMRLWTLHPRYLDAQGLTALWR